MFKKIDKGICAPKGFTANGLHCGIRKNKSKNDLALIYSEVMASCASTYTLNKVKGAPIDVTKKHLHDNKAQAIIINSGNANTCNVNGIEIANEMCELTAAELGLKADDVVVASTGVIGEVLKIDPIANSMHKLVKGLSTEKFHEAWQGIRTTDTKEKQFAIELELNGKTCKIGAMCKGSGMIHPNMATMLAFVTSDVAIDPKTLNKLVKSVVDDTFNMVSVDGDTSTNDMLSVMCNGLAGNKEITKEGSDYDLFKQALYEICVELSKAIAADGEGATKLLTCNVKNACDKKNAKIVAKSVITSSLVKAAMFGRDANWGRILCAIGYSEAKVDVLKVDVTLSSCKGDILVCENGKGVGVLSTGSIQGNLNRKEKRESGIDEEKALEILAESEVEINIDLKDGDASATAWGCDLTYEYVKINGEYRT